MIHNTLWVEKYRPQTLDTYIGNESLKKSFSFYITGMDIPHLLLHGNAGGGKTTLAKIIANSIAEGNYLYINASDENSVDTVREKIKQFAASVGFGGLKIVILDEADFTTPNFQAALRNVMETYSRNTRFILTCNYVDKIIEPIQSRCQAYHVVPPSRIDVAKLASKILTDENIEFDKKALATIVNQHFPDVRKVINNLQMLSINGKLELPVDADLNTSLNSNILNVLLGNSSKSNTEKFNEIRQQVADSLIRDFNPLYRFIYDSIELFPEQARFSVLLIMADAQYKDAFVVDHEINAMSAFYKILEEVDASYKIK